MNVGLGNNGGSSTIVKSANTLISLGHDVTIIDTSKPCYNFDIIYAKHKIIKNEKDIPNADVIIGTGFSSWKSTLELPSRCGRKFIYLRGWETWNASEKVLFSILSNKNLLIIANSQCLVQKLSERGIIPWLVRPGNDFGNFTNKNLRGDNDYITLGGLYNFGGKRSTKRTDWILDTYNKIKKEYPETKLIMFGCEGTPLFKVDMYYDNPSDSIKNHIYNLIDIWLAPSELEGLHIPPQEAMLTECCVVGTCSQMSGTQDYLIDGKTGAVSENNISDFISKVKVLINSQEMRQEYGHEGKLKIRSLGDRTENMRNLSRILEINI